MQENQTEIKIFLWPERGLLSHKALTLLTFTTQGHFFHLITRMKHRRPTSLKDLWLDPELFRACLKDQAIPPLLKQHFYIF